MNAGNYKLSHAETFHGSLMCNNMVHICTLFQRCHFHSQMISPWRGLSSEVLLFSAVLAALLIRCHLYLYYFYFTCCKVSLSL